MRINLLQANDYYAEDNILRITGKMEGKIKTEGAQNRSTGVSINGFF